MYKSKPVLYRNPDEEREKFSFSERTFPPKVVKTHFHNFIEVEFLIDGTATQILNGIKQEMPSGSLTMLRLTDYHSITYNSPVTILNFSFDESMIPSAMQNQFTAQSKPPQFIASSEQSTAIEGIFFLCVQESKRAFPNEKYIQNLVECLLIIITNSEKQQYKATENEAVILPVQSALCYMKTHFRENPSLAAVAAINNYTPCHFSTVFHKHTGSTYSQYLLALKIDYAKRLLLNTNLNVENIAIESGFASYSRFLQAFKEIVSVSPTQFRGRKQNEK